MGRHFPTSFNGSPYTSIAEQATQTESNSSHDEQQAQANAAAYERGWNEGVEDGRNEGLNQGKNLGWSEGYSAGYLQGQIDGAEDKEKSDAQQVVEVAGQNAAGDGFSNVEERQSQRHDDRLAALAAELKELENDELAITEAAILDQAASEEQTSAEKDATDALGGNEEDTATKGMDGTSKQQIRKPRKPVDSAENSKDMGLGQDGAKEVTTQLGAGAEGVVTHPSIANGPYRDNILETPNIEVRPPPALTTVTNKGNIQRRATPKFPVKSHGPDPFQSLLGFAKMKK